MTKNNEKLTKKTALLVEHLQAVFGLSDGPEDEIDHSLKYVIYVRKSTDTSEKQERSIGDQIAECKAFAERNGLRYANIIHEEQSAKVSEKRPEFRAMLEDVKNGKYDGILAWSPDRLARNMKEGGEIIDMLDRVEIADIKFANGHSFTNDPSGKMMLGLAFVMAKQYSDQHSQNVRRAIRGKASEGKWPGGSRKYGYYKDKNNYLHPDGENFELVKRAFEMRLDGSTLKQIATHLNKHGFPITTKRTKHRELVINEQFVSDLLRDPIYAGAMVYGASIINLLEKYDFQPAVDAGDMERLLQKDGVKKSYTLTEVVKPRGSIKADLMRGMVICTHCNRAMSTGITPKKTPKGTTHYFYYRCDTEGCEKKGKSVRAKVVLNAAFEFLKNHPLTAKKGYEHYKKQMAKKLVKHQQDADKTIKSLKAQKQHMVQRIEDTKGLLQDAKTDKDDVLVKEFGLDLKKHLKKVKELDAELKRQQATKTNANEAIVSFEEFHELFQNIANYIQKIDSMKDLDYIMRKLFMNFYIQDKKVAKITQNSPFRELCVVADSAMVTLRGLPWNQFMEELQGWIRLHQLITMTR
jgi:site-specific DNA recombinase